MKLIATVILAAFLTHAYAQDKFAQGFYVTNDGDSVHGYIKYESNYTTGIVFRPDIKARSKHLAIDEIRCFGPYPGTVYLREQYVKVENLPSTPIFVRSIVDGEIDLIKYRGRYFIGSGNKGHFKLAQGKTSNESQALKNYQANTGAFNILFQDCPEVKEKAQKAFIKEETLVELLRSYHTCTSGTYHEFLPPETKRLNYIGVFVGGNFSSLSYAMPTRFPESSYLYNTKFPVSTQPTLGIIGLLGGKGPSAVLALQGELVYTSAKFNGEYSYTSVGFAGYDIGQTTITTLDYSQLSLKGGLRITRRSNTLNPYVSFGVAAQVFVSLHSSVIQVTRINATVKEESFELPISKSSFAVWTGLGVKRKLSEKNALFLEANYNNSFLSEGGNVSALAIRFGFLF